MRYILYPAAAVIRRHSNTLANKRFVLDRTGGLGVINIAYNMDCMEYMKTLPDKAFDLCICDPPYGIGETAKKALSRARATTKWKSAKPVHYVGNNKWDDAPPPKEYFDELFRVSKNQIIWGANYYPQYMKRSMGWIAWYKKGQNPNSDFSDCEFAYTSFWRAAKLFDFPWVGFGAVNAGEHLPIVS